MENLQLTLDVQINLSNLRARVIFKSRLLLTSLALDFSYRVSLILQRRKVEKELQDTSNLKGPAQAADILANHVPDAKAKGMTIIDQDNLKSRKALE